MEYQADAGLGVHTATWMDLKHMVLNGNLGNKVRCITYTAIDWIQPPLTPLSFGAEHTSHPANFGPGYVTCFVYWNTGRSDHVPFFSQDLRGITDFLFFLFF